MGTSWWMPSLLVTASLSACDTEPHTIFMQTVDQFTVHAVAESPPVFVDRLPPAPYDSVGIIEVAAPADALLPTVVRAARSMGQRVGCDVVVERSIHHIGGEGSRRWTAVVASVQISGDPDDDSSTARPHVSPLLGDITVMPVVPVAPGTPSTVLVQAPAAPDKRQFICGVYRHTSKPAQPAADP
jgi:hypothetical protein